MEKTPIAKSSPSFFPKEDKTINFTDEILKKWKEILKKQMMSFVNSFNKDIKIIQINMSGDSYCSTSGFNRVIVSLRKQLCENCADITSLLPKISQIPRNNNIFYSGMYEGSFFKVNSCPFVDKTYTLQLIPERRRILIEYLQMYTDKGSEGVQFLSIKNPIIHLHYVHILLTYSFARKNIAMNCNRLLAYNCCENFVYIDREFLNIESFLEGSKYLKSFSPLAISANKKELVEEITRGIIKQLVFYFIFLSTYSFIHGSPCIDYIMLEEKTVQRKFLKFDFTSPVYLHIIPSKFSSVIIKNTKGDQFFIKFEITEEYDNFLFEQIDIMLGESFIPYKGDYPKIYMYKIGYRRDSFVGNLRKYSLASISKSFDIVMFLCTLMTLECFHYSIMNSAILKSIWLGLWKHDEAEKITYELKNARNDLNNLLSVISKYYIRFDALEYLNNKITA